MFATLAQLHAALDRVYKLAISLPDAPLARFQVKTAGLPRTTEAERLVVQRIGQDVFREALMDYWGRRCPLTGISEPALLRASHIVPWADCSDAQRLDVHNGIRANHSALILPPRITLPHFSVSSAMSLGKSTGEARATVPLRSTRWRGLAR
jgi:HNH endonuclease